MARRIVISRHAYTRLRERFPGLRDHDRTVTAEILEAIDAGRRSKRPPAFVKYGGSQGKVSTRFVWTELEDKCYVIADKRVNGSPGIIVLTVLSPRDDVAAERQKYVKGPGKQTTKGPHAGALSRLPRLKNPGEVMG